MNVLILSAGWKAPLVESFRDAAHERNGILLAADSEPLCLAFQLADKGIVLPRSDDNDFAEALLGAVRQHGIGIVVPTRDAELSGIAELAPRLADQGCTALVSGQQTLEILQDKNAFHGFCLKEGFPVPHRYLSMGEVPGDAFVFVRRSDTKVKVQKAGPVSRSQSFRADKEELSRLGFDDPDVFGEHIVQEFVDAPEYSIDCLLDFDGKPVQAVARRRVRVHAGEAWVSTVVDDPELCALSLALCSAAGVLCHAVVQAFRDSDGIRFIEVNPRFGGASTLSIRAGLDSPRRLMALAAGDRAESPENPDISYGMTLLRGPKDYFADSIG